MLSWSGHTEQARVDLAALGRGEIGVELPLAGELHAYAAAAVSGTTEELAARRRELVVAAGGDATGTAVMVDAAAVVANFEMMTRLADGTGARFPDDVAGSRAAIVAELGADDLTSRR